MERQECPEAIYPIVSMRKDPSQASFLTIYYTDPGTLPAPSTPQKLWNMMMMRSLERELVIEPSSKGGVRGGGAPRGGVWGGEAPPQGLPSDPVSLNEYEKILPWERDKNLITAGQLQSSYLHWCVF